MAVELMAAMTEVSGMVQGRDTFSFNPYYNATLLKTTQTDKFITSGVMAYNSELSAKISGGGTVVTFPQWKDLASTVTTTNISTDDETVAGTNQIKMLEMQGVVLERNFGISSADLTASVNGQDPMDVMIGRADPTWALLRQGILKEIFLGIMDKTVGGVGMYYDGKAAKLTNEGVLQSAALLGEDSESANTMLIHTQQYLKLQLDKLITYEGGTGGSNLGAPSMDPRIPFYGTKRVIVSDNVPSYLGTVGDTTHAADGVRTYMGFLFKDAAIAYGERMAKTPIAIERDEGAGNGEGIEKVWFRRHFIMHPLGFSYYPQAVQTDLNTAGLVAQGVSRDLTSPSNVNLANSDNWAAITPERQQVPFTGFLSQ